MLKMDLYVYYEVESAHAARLQQLVQALQQRLRGACGGTALKRKPDSPRGLQTWMEIYLDIAPDFARTAADAAAQAGLKEFISGPRHTELFMDMTPCA
jgi:uncharacterized protein Usg